MSAADRALRALAFGNAAARHGRRISTVSAAVWVTCATCGRSKAPRGRSIPMALHGSLCVGVMELYGARRPREGCDGYYEEPRPDCRWPGELTCGPGCNKDVEPPWLTPEERA